MAGAQGLDILRETLTREAGDAPVPSCLNQCRNSELFHCKICSEPFTNIHRFIAHGLECQSLTMGGAGARSIRCPYCGQGFSSRVSLSLHQLVQDISSKGHLNNDDKSSSEVTSEAGSLKAMIIECEARTDRVSRTVSRLTRLARAANLDPVLVLRMEMESVFTRNTVSDNSMEDQKYGLLPENFSEKYLTVNNFDKDSPGDMDKFEAWRTYLENSAGTEDIRDILVEMEDEMDSEKPGPVWPPTQLDTESDSADLVPDQEILQRLKAEMVDQRCPKDIELTLKSLAMTV